MEVNNILNRDIVHGSVKPKPKEKDKPKVIDLSKLAK